MAFSHFGVKMVPSCYMTCLQMLKMSCEIVETIGATVISDALLWNILPASLNKETEAAALY